MSDILAVKGRISARWRKSDEEIGRFTMTLFFREGARYDDVVAVFTKETRLALEKLFASHVQNVEAKAMAAAKESSS